MSPCLSFVADIIALLAVIRHILHLEIGIEKMTCWAILIIIKFMKKHTHQGLMTKYTNQLLFGDNLEIIQSGGFADECVDCIYLDPPFNSKKNYNMLFDERKERRKSRNTSTPQRRAFVDTWTWDSYAAEMYSDLVKNYPELRSPMQAFRLLVGPSSMLAYLTMMAPRLLEFKRILKEDGNIFLHCDSSAGHYLKVLMDSIYKNGFLNEIIWCYDTGGRSKTSFPSKHDIILRYSKRNKAKFYYEQVCLPRDPKTMHESIIKGEDGRLFQRNIKGGKEYRYYLDNGVLPNDWWTDIQALNPAAKERIGYPTQKPEALLERIVKSCTVEGDLVLDPFCGCGTTVSVCEKLNRKWIGIDMSHVAISVVRKRLETPKLKGTSTAANNNIDPIDVDSANKLAVSDRYGFQCWALSLINAVPEKKGMDFGIDGRIFFSDESGRKRMVIVSVKSGSVPANHLRELNGLIQSEKASFAVLVTLKPASRFMRAYAAESKHYKDAKGNLYHRLQIITIEDILSGKKIHIPATRT